MSRFRVVLGPSSKPLKVVKVASSLQALTLSANSIVENSPAGTVVGAILNTTSSSVVSMAPGADGGGRFTASLIGGVWKLVTTATPTDFETATSHSIGLVETKTGVSGSPKTTSGLIVNVTNVNEQPNLAALTGSLSVPENAANTTVVGTPTGYTAGSTKSLSDNAGGRFAINASTGQITVANGSLLNYEAATSHNVTIVETLADSANSPRSTTLSIAVSNLNDTSPTAFSFTDVSSVPLSTLETSNTITIAGLGASDSATASLSGDASSQLQKNGGAWVSGPVTVVNGDTLAVRHTSSASASTAVNTTLTVGSTSDTFTSTTTSAALPAPTGAASFMDGSGNTVTAPIVGQPLFINPGPFSNSPTSYDFQIYADGVAIADAGASGTFTASGERNFTPGDNLIGKQLVVKCHGISGAGTSLTTSDSAATTAVADIVL